MASEGLTVKEVLSKSQGCSVVVIVMDVLGTSLDSWSPNLEAAKAKTLGQPATGGGSGTSVGERGILSWRRRVALVSWLVETLVAAGGCGSFTAGVVTCGAVLWVET